MMNENDTKRVVFPTLLALICIAVISLIGCGGSGGDGGGDGPSYPGYSELDRSFGGVVLNHYADQTITLQNPGSVDIPLGQLEGPDSPFTVVQNDCSGTLNPSETCDIQVRFQPTTQGNHYGGFVVPITGGDQNFVGVNLDGYGWGYNVSINQVETVCPDIQLIVSVTDQNDDPVEGLFQEDFSLYADDAEIQWGSGCTFTPEVTSDLSVILLMDTSGSVSGVLEDIKTAAQAFIGNMGDADEAAVFKITNIGAEKVSGAEGFVTTNAAGIVELQTTIENSITSAAGYTALYQAVLDVSDHIVDYANPDNRRAVVLITDGEDTSSPEGTGLDEAIAAAQEAGVPVFTIGLGVADDYTEVITQLSDDTGGQSFMEPSPEELEMVYERVYQLLSSQYLIVYSPATNGGATISLRVAVDDGDYYGEDTREAQGCP